MTDGLLPCTGHDCTFAESCTHAAAFAAAAEGDPYAHPPARRGAECEWFSPRAVAAELLAVPDPS